MSYNFRLFRRRRRPVVCRPLSSLAVVFRPPRVVASSAACSPRVVGYRPLAQQPLTSSLRPPPPPALFSRSSRRPPPALTTANQRCRPTAPILALLRPLPAHLLLVARQLSASIVVVGAREGKGGMPPARSLFRRSDQRKRRCRSTTIACRLRPRPRGWGGGVGRRRRPSPRRRFRRRRRGDDRHRPPPPRRHTARCRRSASRLRAHRHPTRAGGVRPARERIAVVGRVHNTLLRLPAMDDYSIVSPFFFFFFVVVDDCACDRPRGGGTRETMSVIGRGARRRPTTAADGRINGILISPSDVP